jgi:type III pantothenate kinase
MSGALLLVDVGNSRIKWALVQSPEWLADGISSHSELSGLMQAWDRFPRPAKVVACNVAGEERGRLLADYWQARDVPLHWMKSPRSGWGVRNLYDRPQQLGGDRWASLVGAWGRARGACLVVSAGTALTMDALNERGEFIGGLIMPGKQLMLRSLAEGTHALDESSGLAREFPRSTADAMTSGIATAMSSAVEASCRRLESACKSRPACILSGGDADWLAKQLQIGVIIAPRLPLEGLLIMATGEEEK